MYGLIILTGCPDGYTGGIYGFQCYKIIIDLSINWNAARDLCYADNAYLSFQITWKEMQYLNMHKV